MGRRKKGKLRQMKLLNVFRAVKKPPGLNPKCAECQFFLVKDHRTFPAGHGACRKSQPSTALGGRVDVISEYSIVRAANPVCGNFVEGSQDW
jgi:hypothetical protein